MIKQCHKTLVNIFLFLMINITTFVCVYKTSFFFVPKSREL